MTHSWLLKTLLSSPAIFLRTKQQLAVACQQLILKEVKGSLRKNAVGSENPCFSLATLVSCFQGNHATSVLLHESSG